MQVCLTRWVRGLENYITVKVQTHPTYTISASRTSLDHISTPLPPNHYPASTGRQTHPTAMSSRIPHLLEQYLALPPEAALILLTSVLGASSNWLVLRFLYAHLKLASSSPAEQAAAAGYEGSSTPADGRAGGGGSVGVALVSFMRDGAFWRDGAGRMGLDLDAMGRGGRFAFVDGLTGLFSSEEEGNSVVRGGRSDGILRSSKVEDVEAAIVTALGQLQTDRKVLIIDQLDVLLAASEEDVTSTSLSGMLLSLREV